MNSDPATSPGELPRWVQIPVGLLLGAFTLLCAAGSLTLILSPPDKNPALASGVGALMLLACLWLLSLCLRLVLGIRRGGLFAPTALRVIAWVFLLLPLGGFFNGYYHRMGFAAIVQALVYVAIFFALRRMARSREGLDGNWIDPQHPLFQDAVNKARATLPQMRELQAQHPDSVIVKFPFHTDSGQLEHVWGVVRKLSADSLEASIITPPHSQRGAVPDPATVLLADLEDWHCQLPDGGIRGSYTTRAEAAIRRQASLPIPRHIRDAEKRMLDA